MLPLVRLRLLGVRVGGHLILIFADLFTELPTHLEENI